MFDHGQSLAVHRNGAVWQSHMTFTVVDLPSSMGSNGTALWLVLVLRSTSLMVDHLDLAKVLRRLSF